MTGEGSLVTLTGLLSILVLLLSKPAVSDPDSKISCTEVVTNLTPCLNYVTDKENTPSAQCCSGVKAVNGLVKTKADRQAVCECIKQAMGNIKYDAGRVVSLPQKCGVSYDFPPFIPTIDCSKA